MDWKRIIDIVKKTGERCVVIDPDHEEPVVIMLLEEYEHLADTHFMDNDFDFECDDHMPLDIPFETEDAWKPEFDVTESPILEEIIEPVVESATDDESWYIEPIGD